MNLYKEIGDIRNGLAHNTFMKVPETTFSQQLKQWVTEHVRYILAACKEAYHVTEDSRTFGTVWRCLTIMKGYQTRAKGN